MAENDQLYIHDGRYYGRILAGDYSPKLKEKIAGYIMSFKTFEDSGAPVIPYIAAWNENEKIIWYEFAGAEFIKLLECNFTEIAEVFRKRIIDRRVYKYLDLDMEIQEEIIPGKELFGWQEGLREESKQTGFVEAVYKVAIKDNNILWLKDRANIETFSKDNICISLGCLTDVTKEMEQKDLLEKIGYIDELTKLPNRKILQRITEINIGQVNRKHLNDFIFSMIDIDHFKLVNDTYGHQAGDYVLANIAEVMTSMKRVEDEIGRYGGEEFYTISHGNIHSGRVLAERLRKKVENTDFIYNGQHIKVTISIGLASAVELEILEAHNLIELADKRLYMAKQSGRNCLVWQG
ncbi:MAG: GGDEF domain-containing protein [Desulfobacterium sp.]|nr:GGDEF domain-containing protein [Desulfobacterium sp.]MBU3949892.1 GGDEF domain-containing protein [Pseudomonadota bacterium]